MKKRLSILLIIILVLSMSGVSYLQWGPVPAGLITGISVSSAESDLPVYHPLDQEEARLLALNLNEAVTTEIDVSGDAELAMTLHFKAPVQREYALNVSQNDVSQNSELLLQRSGRETAMLSLNPTFFLNHSAFITTFYPQAQPPRLKISSLDESLSPPLNIETWAYQRWDEQ